MKQGCGEIEIKIFWFGNRNSTHLIHQEREISTYSGPPIDFSVFSFLSWNPTYSRSHLPPPLLLLLLLLGSPSEIQEFSLSSSSFSHIGGCLIINFSISLWHRLCSFCRELRFQHCRRPSAAPIPCLPPAPSRPFVVLRLPTSSANERLLAPDCGEVPRGADRGVHAGPLTRRACRTPQGSCMHAWVCCS